MSKTIEVISIHKGKIAISCKGESRTVVFEDKGDVGIAMCDHDEAAVFLKIGLPDYWKEGVVLKDEKTPPVQPDAKRMNAADTIALIKAAMTIAEVDEMLVDEERKGVLAAADERKKELAE